LRHTLGGFRPSTEPKVRGSNAIDDLIDRHQKAPFIRVLVCTDRGVSLLMCTRRQGFRDLNVISKGRSSVVSCPITSLARLQDFGAGGYLLKKASTGIKRSLVTE